MSRSQPKTRLHSGTNPKSDPSCNHNESLSCSKGYIPCVCGIWMLPLIRGCRICIDPCFKPYNFKYLFLFLSNCPQIFGTFRYSHCKSVTPLTKRYFYIVQTFVFLTKLLLIVCLDTIISYCSFRIFLSFLYDMGTFVPVKYTNDISQHSRVITVQFSLLGFWDGPL